MVPRALSVGKVSIHEHTVDTHKTTVEAHTLDANTTVPGFPHCLSLSLLLLAYCLLIVWLSREQNSAMDVHNSAMDV